MVLPDRQVAGLMRWNVNLQAKRIGWLIFESELANFI